MMRAQRWMSCVGLAALLSAASLPVGAAVRHAPVWHGLYASADYAFLTLSVNHGVPGGLDPRDYQARLVELRAGYRIHDHLGLEFHYGIPASGGSAPDRVAIRHRYGLFIAPNGVLFRTLEVAVPIGYAWGIAKQALPGQPARSMPINGVVAGLDLALPLRTVLAGSPDLRLLAGANATVQRSDSELYGFHLGLRYDF